nr:RIP metalloprotease RseP [Oscillatoria laete-virens]
MIYLYIVFAIVFFFSLAVGVHEWGHMLAARWRGLKVERFAIGFGPPLVTWRRKGVDYAICSIPLGGYVALPQMAPMEAIEGETDSKREQLPPITPVDKMIVAFAGPLFSFLLAVALSLIVWVAGIPSDKSEFITTIGYVDAKMPAAAAGLRVGDKIIAIDGNKTRKWRQVMLNIILGTGKEVVFTVERDGKILTIAVPPSRENEDRLRRVGIQPAMTFLAGPLIKDSPLELAGARPGDELVSLDGIPVTSYSTIMDVCRENVDHGIPLTVLRDGQTIETTIIPRKPKGMEQVILGNLEVKGEAYVDHPNPAQQISEILYQTKRILVSLFSPGGGINPSHLSSAVGIFDAYSQMVKYDIRLALWFSVLFNVSLAIFNLLPLPVLDGGHILLALIEKIRGREMNIKILNAIQTVFVVLLLGLFVYVTFFDVKRLARRQQQEKLYQEEDRKVIEFAPPEFYTAPDQTPEP